MTHYAPDRKRRQNNQFSNPTNTRIFSFGCKLLDHSNYYTDNVSSTRHVSGNFRRHHYNSSHLYVELYAALAVVQFRNGTPHSVVSRSSLCRVVKYVAFADCAKRSPCPQRRKINQNRPDSSDRIRFSTGSVRISVKPVRPRYVGGEHVRSRRPSELRAHALESHFRPNKSVDEKQDNGRPPFGSGTS